jgi:nicotinamidase-related amidase
MTTALLLIDIQNDYLPGGRMELEKSCEASKRASEVLHLFREKTLPVFHVRHESTKEGATFFLPGTSGVDFSVAVAPVTGENVITKNYPNCFRDTALLSLLRDAGVTRLVIVGMMTHMCVDAGVRAAVDFGFECAVVSDACATRSLVFDGVTVPAAHVHGTILAALGAAYATIVTASDVAGWI